MSESAEPPSLLKRALLALEKAEARVAELERGQNAPIAVIGLGCRVPGADDPAAFWELLEQGRDAVGPTPEGRWDPDAYYDPNPDTPGHIAAKNAGYLRGPVDRFDAAFFGIAPREAQNMDPQQRLLLEVSWEALEHAGQAPKRLERSKTGVYFGVCASDYANLQLKTHDLGLLDAHFTSGIAHSIASGRLSYLLGLQGPSLSIDTACSSSLVAVHLACQALKTGDCRMALAGGVNLMLAPELYIALSRARMLSPDGRCKTFDAAADGFGRGEGCGVVVLKRLADAQADGDRVLAVIRGSAVNQDGPSGSLTAPNGPAQEAVIREALSRGGLTPKDVGYIEAHGTGTELGDPLEVQALGAVFGEERGASPPLWLGSVKTNLGHLEGAAGVVGLIKLVLSLRNARIPAHLHFKNPSPHIPWSDFPFRVPTALSSWEPIAGRRIGGVSSFGFSGTNAHVVVEDAPAPAPNPPVESRLRLFALSARDAKVLPELASRYAASAAGRPDAELADLAATMNLGRSHFEHRAVVLARSSAELRDRLAALAEGRATQGVKLGRGATREPPRVAFLFTGQGAQYAGMTRGLYETAPVFRAALDRCAELLAPHLERPLLDVLFPEPGRATPLDETAYTQPALFAVEYALAELWRSLGVLPEIVIGHSVGEYTAMCVSGILDLESAARLIAARGRLMQSLPGGGTMSAIFAPEARVAEAVERYRDTVSIAGVNGPEQTVISGAARDVEAICQRLGAEGLRCQPLPVSHAFHSPLVEPILDTFEREAASVRFATPRIKFVSNVTGRLLEPGQTVDAAYLRKHLRSAVRFDAGLRSLLALKPGVAVEIGPHPTLLSFAKAVFGEQSPPLVASLRKHVRDDEQWLDAVADLYLAGAELDFRALAPGPAHRVVDLPSYAFRRERFWFQAKPRAPSATRGSKTGHPILGTRLRLSSADPVFESEIGADSPAFVRQHGVQGQVVVPATAYLEALLSLSRRFGSASAGVTDVTIEEALLLDPDGTTRTLQFVVSPARDGGMPVTVSSIARDSDDENFRRHVTAVLRPVLTGREGAVTFAEARARCTRSIPVADHYAGFERRGLGFGPDFRVVRELWCGDSEALGRIELTEALAREAPSYGIHPVLLDGCLQVLAGALAEAAPDALYLPIAFGAYTLTGNPGVRCTSYVRVSEERAETRRADVFVFDEQGAPLAELREVTLKRVARDALSRITERWLDESVYEIGWRDAPEAAHAPALGGAAPEALLAIARQVLPRLREAAGFDSYDRFLPRLEQLCVSFTLAAMLELGWTPSVGERVAAPALAERLGVLGKHGRLFTRLLAILAEAGFLERGARDFTVARAFPEVEPETELLRLSGSCPDAEPELELTGRTAGELAQALRGEVDPIQLLFPGGSLTTAERLYRDTPTAKFYNGLTAEIMAGLAAARAEGRPLRILEVGAGTGGTTSHVAPRLPLQGVEYTYTDVGPLFVARARERFAAYPFLRYQVLDLERDPESQGLAEGTFDVLIASNVVHATADLEKTLAKLRRLLAPGGLLAMLEVTAPQRWFDLTVGLTEGWWAFSDTHLRSDYPTLSRAKWFEVLERAGFEQTVALPEGDGHSGALALQSLFLARSSTSRAPRDWLLFADQGGYVAALAQTLRARGDRCTLVSRGPAFSFDGDSAAVDPSASGDFERLLEAFASSGRSLHGAVHGFALDLYTAASSPSESLRDTVSAVSLLQALMKAAPTARVWFVTRGAVQAGSLDPSLEPLQAPIVGLGRALRAEHPELRAVFLDVDPASVGAERLAAELETQAVEPEVALRAGARRVSRLAASRAARPRPTVGASGPFRLRPTTPGSLEAFSRVPLALPPLGAGEVEIEVAATGLNFKDVLNALGMYPGDPGPLGGECAGTVVRTGPGVSHVKPGDAVFAVAPGCFSSHVIARAELVQPRPAGVNAEEGAAFPIAFLTAEFCLGHLAKVRAGDRVLIHAGAGGVGMAAVQLALRAGAEVFATAGSEWKRDLLRSLGVAHVLDSRSSSFAAEIERITGGAGVSVVLNSLSGELIDDSFRVLARGGRFIEIGKRGIKEPSWVAALGRDIDYQIVDWGETSAREPELIGSMFARLTTELGEGRLTSLPRHTFSLDDASRAFRFMAQANHAGRIVLRHGPSQVPVARRDGTYLVTGGLSGLGPVIAGFLAERGAGRIVLVGRRAVTDELRASFEPLTRAGTQILAESVDVSDEPALRALLSRLRKDGPPLRGVVHGAGLLDDAAILQQDAARFAHVFGPKVTGGALLDRLTRGEPLDWFVLFSSIAAVLGSPGQSNHSAANAYLDLLARERVAHGLPGLSIDWGAWSEVGAAADRGIVERLGAQGIGAITPAQGLVAFERLLTDGNPQVAVLPMDWQRFAERAHGGKLPPMFSELSSADSASARQASSANGAAPAQSLREQLAGLPESRVRPVVGGFVRERALRALGLDPSREIDPSTPLRDLGLDSLLSVELRNTLGAALGRSMPATLLFDYPSLETLTDFIVGECLGLSPQVAPAPAPARANLVDSIEDLSDEDVERELAALAKKR